MSFIRSYILPFVAVAAVVLVLLYVQRPGPVIQSDMAQVEKEAGLGGLYRTGSLFKLNGISKISGLNLWSYRLS